MMHGLPVKPAFLGPPPTTTTLSLLPPPRPISHPSPIASSSTIPYTPSPLQTSTQPVDTTKCGLCALPPKYTCPRCSLRTCSLPCSIAHKAKYSCTGIRRAEGYVSLREYGQGEWAEDYRYLEEGRRKVEGWGQSVKEEELASGSAAGLRGIGSQNSRGRGNGTGDRGRGGRDRPRRSKTHALQMELRGKGVWAEFMPDGMGRRRLNQSSWNNKTGILSLTVQLSIPQDLLAEVVEPKDPKSEVPLSETTPAGSEPTATDGSTASSKAPTESHPGQSAPKLILHPRTSLIHPRENPLPTLNTLLPPLTIKPNDTILILPFFPSPARPAPSTESPSQASRLFFPPLNPDIPLVEVFKGTAWVEFPTIHIMSKAAWTEGLNNGKYGIVPLAQPRKRTREDEDGEGVTPKRWGEERDSGWGKRAGKVNSGVGGVKRVKQVGEGIKAEAAIGALGEYASDSEEEEEGEIGLDGGHDHEGLQEEDGDEVGDDDAVFDIQPGGAEMLAGLPQDLLIAMSHAIDADMA